MILYSAPPFPPLVCEHCKRGIMISCASARLRVGPASVDCDVCPDMSVLCA